MDPPIISALNDGAPIRAVFPSSGVPAIANVALQPAKAPHPEAGMVFLNWAPSMDGQKALLDTAGSPVARPGAGSPKVVPGVERQKIILSSDLLEISQGELVSLLGPGGCGKTATLRCIAGLETPEEGFIGIDGEAVFDSAKGVAVEPYHRYIGMVFRSYASWPHLTVFENVAFPRPVVAATVGRAAAARRGGARDRGALVRCRRLHHTAGHRRGNDTMGLTAVLCERIASLGYDDIQEPALAAARRLVLDGLAVGVAGVSEEDAIPIMARVVKELGGNPVATVIGCGFRTDPVRAAAINGAAMHVLDFEPMWSPATHALSVTLPVALALAEARGLPGREILAALVKGLEIQGWLREASGQYTPDVLQFHPPGLVGPMGAVVVASHLMKLDPLRMANAFGIAGSRAGSLFGNVGTMTKSAHCGQAAAMGLEAALLAEAGFTGDTETFESPLGYANSFYRGTFKPQDMMGYGIGAWRVAEPGYAIKMFPSQFGTHFGITAGLELHKRLPDASAIKAVTLTGPVMPYVNRPFPETGLSGKFSLQYTMASALLDGHVGIHTFTEEKLHRPDMQALLGKVTLEMDKSIEARFETMHVRLRVELNDGSVLETRCDGPRGIWGQPPIAEADHLVKVRDCLGVALSAEAIENVIRLGARIDTLTPAQVSDMMTLLA